MTVVAKAELAQSYMAQPQMVFLLRSMFRSVVDLILPAVVAIVFLRKELLQAENDI